MTVRPVGEAFPASNGMELDPRLHFVTVTGIIVKNDDDGEPKFLIAKRAPHEKAFPNKWTVPGGKLVRTEYENLPKRPYAAGQKESTAPQWYEIVDWVLRKEIREEVGLEIEKPRYLTDLTFIRPDGYPVLTLSYWCRFKSGEVRLCKDLTDHSWATLEEARNYDLIEGIWEELRDVRALLAMQ